MDRLTRKELKTDRFAVEVSHTVSFLTEHRQQAIRYGIVAAVVLVVALGAYLYARHQRNARHAALQAALRIYETQVGTPDPGSYPTVAERDKALVKAFSEVTSRYSSSEEAIAARYYLGALAASQGRYADAENALRPAAESGASLYASLAKLALAELYAGQGKLGEAERILRGLMAQPTLFVSKEQAAIELARLLGPTKPAEARKLLDPLRTDKRSTVSRAALTVLGGIPSK